MVVGAAHCVREPEPIHRNAGRTFGEHPRPRILSVAVEIDQDVNVVSFDPVATLLVVQRADIDPMLGRSLEARLRRVSPGDPAIIGEDLEILAIV